MGMSQEGMHTTNHLYKYTRCYNDIVLYIGVLHQHYIHVIQYIIMISQPITYCLKQLQAT